MLLGNIHVRSTIKSIIVKPMEWHLASLAFFVVSLFYLQIVITPTILVGVIGVTAFNFLEYGLAINVVYGFAFAGSFLGVIWAERIRKSLGIVAFHAYLLSTPEIDGWRDSAGNKISKK